DRSFYERLAVHCSGPLADVLWSDGPLDNARLDRVEALLAMDPIILSLHGILDRPLYQIGAVDILIAFLRAHGTFAEDGLRLPHTAGLPAVIRRLQAAVDWIEAPSPGFSLAFPFRIIRSVRELREVGAKLKNCVRNYRSYGTDHFFRLAEGSAIYITSDAPPMLAVVQQVGPALWTLDELNGPANARINAATKVMLIDALHAAGIRILSDSPANALSLLTGVHALRDDENADADDDEAIDDAIPSSGQNPKILGRDDTEVIRYLITIGVPFSGHLLAQKGQDRRFEVGECLMTSIMGDMLVHQAP